MTPIIKFNIVTIGDKSTGALVPSFRKVLGSKLLKHKFFFSQFINKNLNTLNPKGNFFCSLLDADYFKGLNCRCSECSYPLSHFMIQGIWVVVVTINGS